MRSLVLTCECGQRMQVPRTAVGKTGLCPRCGTSIRVTGRNTSPLRNRRRASGILRKGAWWRGQAEPSEEAKQLFGQAVDLYYARRYGEALAIFDRLAKQFPGNPDVERGRTHCVSAMRRPALPGADTGHLLPENTTLDVDTVKRVVLDKMLHSSSDAIQLQAAELAARILGIYDGEKAEPAETEPQAATSNDEADVSESDEADVRDEESFEPEEGEMTDDGPSIEEVVSSTLDDREEGAA